jgi:anti-sigma regulatory factor (Ser/Thr protein kinase)
VNSLAATLTGRPGQAAEVARMVDELARVHRLSPGVVADVQVALDEVLANIVRHGPVDRVCQIRVRLTVHPDAFEAEVEDDGAPFDPLAVPPPDLRSPLRERRAGGLGIHFLRSLMSEVTYARVDDRNRLVLRRRLASDREAEIRGTA